MFQFSWHTNTPKKPESAGFFLFGIPTSQMACHLQTQVGLSLSWNTIQYMVAEVQYGGRITDDLDRELFTTYAAKWLNESMTLGEPSH